MVGSNFNLLYTFQWITFPSYTLNFVSRSYLVLLRYIFLVFFFHLHFFGDFKYSQVLINFFFPESPDALVVLFLLLFLFSHFSWLTRPIFSMLNSIPVSWMNIHIVCTRFFISFSLFENNIILSMYIKRFIFSSDLQNMKPSFTALANYKVDWYHCYKLLQWWVWVSLENTSWIFTSARVCPPIVNSMFRICIHVLIPFGDISKLTSFIPVWIISFISEMLSFGMCWNNLFTFLVSTLTFFPILIPEGW